MVQLQIIRHGDALVRHPDAERPLSEGGVKSIQRLRCLIGSDLPDFVVSSPLIRARQTAEILADANRYVVWDEVLPGGEPNKVLSRIEAEGFSCICIVSHQPLVGRLIGHLTGEASFGQIGRRA